MSTEELRQLTKDELYDRAQQADIAGRSEMTKAELVEALSSDGGQETDLHDEDWTHSGERSDTKRATWTGSIAFGLITIPVRLHTATEDRDVSFHLLTADDHARVRYQKVSSQTGDPVDWDDIVRGFEYEAGHYVIFTDEELDEIAAKSSKVVDVVQFVRDDDIDPVYFDRSYYVSPDESGTKAYRVLARALSESGRVGIGKVTIRDKERPCAIRVDEEVLLLDTMKWPDEVRVPAFETLEGADDPTEAEVKMAQQLIDAMTAEFEPDRLTDEHRRRLEEAISAKISGEEIAVAPVSEEAQAPVGDLMEALRASVDASGERRRSA
jgi:DNA end-binding protein Ku